MRKSICLVILSVFSYISGVYAQEIITEEVTQLKVLAEQGDADAQSELGIHYFYGDGVTKNISEAIKWIEKAAEQGDPLEQIWLGTCYENGHVVAKSITEAKRWYQKAAEQGDEFAKDALNRLK